jgi:hypothetical protein
MRRDLQNAIAGNFIIFANFDKQNYKSIKPAVIKKELDTYLPLLSSSQ